MTDRPCSRADANHIWTDDISVLFTSFWGWNPGTWGAVGWSGKKGATRRANLMKELSDPFICVLYITSNQTEADPDMRGKIVGFYLVSHEKGHRNEFTHPTRHNDEPDKWEHSLRAIRAFQIPPRISPQGEGCFPRAISKGKGAFCPSLGRDHFRPRQN